MKKAPLLLSLMSFFFLSSLEARISSQSPSLFREPFCFVFSLSAPPLPHGLPNWFTYQHHAFRDTNGLSFLQFISSSGSASSPLYCLSEQCHSFQGAYLSIPNVMQGSVFTPLLNVGCFHSEVLSGLLSTCRYIQYRGQKETQWMLHQMLSNTVHRIYAQNEQEEGH